MKIGRPLPAPLSSSVLFWSAMASVVMAMMEMRMRRRRRRKRLALRVLVMAGRMDLSIEREPI